MTTETTALAAALRDKGFAEAAWDRNAITSPGFYVSEDHRRGGLVCVQHLTVRTGGTSRGEYEHAERRIARRMSEVLNQDGWATRLDETRRRVEILDGQGTAARPEEQLLISEPVIAVCPGAEPVTMPGAVPILQAIPRLLGGVPGPSVIMIGVPPRELRGVVCAAYPMLGKSDSAGAAAHVADLLPFLRARGASRVQTIVVTGQHELATEITANLTARLRAAGIEIFGSFRVASGPEPGASRYWSLSCPGGGTAYDPFPAASAGTSA